jgi:hypothetical protein
VGQAKESGRRGQRLARCPVGVAMTPYPSWERRRPRSWGRRLF